MYPNFWAQRAQPYQFQPPQFAGMQPPQMQQPMGMPQGFQNPFAARMPMQGAPMSMMRPAMQDGPMPGQPQPFQPQMPPQAQAQLPPQAMPQQQPMQMPMQNNFMRARMAM